MENTVKYNELPVITFRWLKANHLNLIPNEPGEGDFRGEYVVEGRENIRRIDSRDRSLIGDLPAVYEGTNEIELNKSLNRSTVVNVIESSHEERTVRLRYMADDSSGDLIERNHILVKKGETLNVVLEYRSEDSVKEVSTLNIINVEDGGRLNLLKVNHLSLSTRHLDQRYTLVGEKGSFHFTSVDLGGSETIVNYRNDLKGDEADGNLDSIYMVNGNRTLDLSHYMNHMGESCTSNMDLKGALSHRAKKYWRGTLNFEKGSAQSEGGEIETVTLLDPTVRSYAIPLLLCGEHDVIGNHAASAGQIDEEKLFYLMSRGFSKAESRKIIVESSFRPVIDAVPYEDIREDILSTLDEMLKKVD